MSVYVIHNDSLEETLHSVVGEAKIHRWNCPCGCSDCRGYVLYAWNAHRPSVCIVASTVYAYDDHVHLFGAETLEEIDTFPDFATRLLSADDGLQLEVWLIAGLREVLRDFFTTSVQESVSCNLQNQPNN